MAKASHDEQVLGTIGYICVQWALLETLLIHSIFAMLDMPHKTGAIAFGGLDMLPRANMVINLARHFKAPKPITDRLVEIRKALQDGLSDRRNQAIHGVHADADAPDAVRLTMMRWAEAKRTQDVSVAELYQTGLDIKRLAEHALMVFVAIGEWKFGGHRLEG